MSTGIISWVRTIVPIGIGAAVAWLLTLGIEVDATTQNSLVVGVTGLVIAAYYSLVRLLEKKFPWIGVLLGVAKSPDGYSKGEVSDSFEGQASVTVETTVVAPASSTPIYDDLAAIPYLHN